MANRKRSSNKSSVNVKGKLSPQQEKINKINKMLAQRPIDSWEYPKVLLGIPLERSVSYSNLVFHPFMAIASTGVARLVTQYQRTDVARNRMAMSLLESDYTHLLMLDVDQVHPENIIEKLCFWTLLEPDVKIVGGLNFKRGEPYEPCAYIKGEDNMFRPIASWSPGLLEVDSIGTGSILIHREVFENIKPLWFEQIYSPNEVLNNRFPGEDSFFCQKAKEAGYKIYVDTTVRSPHVTEAIINEDTFVKHATEVRKLAPPTKNGIQLKWGTNLVKKKTNETIQK